MKKSKTCRTMDINGRKKELFRLLLTNEKCTLEYLANSLNVCKRTVKRYLDELEETVPLRISAGRYSGGVRLENKMKGRSVLKKTELHVLEKIVSETEKTGCCTLDTLERLLLKEMLYRYS